MPSALCLLPFGVCTEYTTIFRDYVDTYINAGTLDRWALDSLCLGQYTKQLGFVRW